jgi:hypothetical protein
MKYLLIITLLIALYGKPPYLKQSHEAKIVLSTLYLIDEHDSSYVSVENYIEIDKKNLLKGIQVSPDQKHTTYYTVSLTDEDIANLNNLVSNENALKYTNWEPSPPYLNYCGPTYKLELLVGKDRKYAIFDPTDCNMTQSEIMKWFDRIVKVEPKQSIAPFDISPYVSNSLIELKEYFSYVYQNK